MGNRHFEKNINLTKKRFRKALRRWDTPRGEIHLWIVYIRFGFTNRTSQAFRSLNIP